MRRPLARPLLALAVAAMGAVDLLSALLSHPPERVVALRHLVPTDILDTSRTFTLLAGALLVLTANGLRRGKRRAFVTALLLAAVSVPVNVLKAGDVEEATLAASLMMLLGLHAHAFTVKSRVWSWRRLASPALLAATGVVVYSVLGCWLVERSFGPGAQASLGRAVQEAVYQMFGLGEPALVVTRAQHVVRWYLGSISVLGMTLLVGFVLVMLQPARHRGRHRAEADRVRALVQEHGSSTVSWFALDDDVDWFFSANNRAVIAYRYEADVLLAIGDPIGPAEEIAPLLETFEQFCREHDWTFAFYQARPEVLPSYRARGWRAVHIGEDPVLEPARFTLEGAAMGDVRRSVRRLEREGVEVRHFVPGAARFSAAPDHPALLEALRSISAEWLHDHAGGEKGFCMSRFQPARLDEVWLAIAWRPATQRVEAFNTWVPVPARHGWALDLMRRRPGAAPGLMELLVTRAVEHARARGDELLSLALSALAKVDEPIGDAPPEASAPDPARTFLSERLARFYDFQGLFRWKRKFSPRFEDRYLVFPDALALPKIALALVRAQTPGGLLAMLRPEPRTQTGPAPVAQPELAP